MDEPEINLDETTHHGGVVKEHRMTALVTAESKCHQMAALEVDEAKFM